MLVEAERLTKKFGDFVAVNELSLTLAEGEILALLGPNGAGKTTTVRMLASILKPTSGRARVAGLDVVADAQAVRHAVGLLTELPGLYSRMTALAYLDFFGTLQHIAPEQTRRRGEELLKRFDLWESRQRRLGTYSKGMRQKIAIVRAMLHEPLVLFLDEPTSAMDPHSAKQVRDAVLELKALGRTILLCTHNLPEAELVADRIAIVRRGQIVAAGTSAQLKRNLLGDPVMDVRLIEPLDGLWERFGIPLNVIEQGPNWFRYRTDQPEAVNPAVLKRLADLGRSVFSLGPLERSLEDVYLKIVQE
ncbi:MAG: ABC transporter ATP-binding protein [Chloroflexi bacterium]|nr:ABC transporter ATP-binding protein [Chloroflexota bacterium]